MAMAKMNTKPFFSVCIPTYNRAHLLPAAIDSVLAQNFNDYEFVIVDNASTDNTQEVLKRYTDPRIRMFRNPETVSMYANHNKCIEYARAEWVVFLHSDDQLKLNGLSTIANLCENSNLPDAITYTGEYYSDFWASLKHEDFYIIKDCSDGVLLFRYMGLYTLGSCFRRDLLINFGKYDENSLLADYDLYLKLIEKKAKIMITPNSVIEIGTTERTTSKLIREKTWIFEQGRIVAKYAQHDIFKELLPVSIETWKPFEVARFLMYLVAGNEKRCLKQ